LGILALGLSHHEAPLELRERLALSSGQIPNALDTLGHYACEGVILSTCNRTEVYAVVGHRRSGREQLARFLSEVTGVPSADFASLAYDHWQDAAARHLFRVAAGLESLVVGEPQILGQVRDAFDASLKAESAGPHLSRLFRHARSVGKAARSKSAISRGAASVTFAAVELARATLGSLEGRRVLVIGAGETGALAASTLLKHGAAELLISNRTEERARWLAERNSARVIPFDRLADGIAESDIVVSCTSAPDHIAERGMVERAMVRRPTRPLLVMDIAVPRDFAADVGDVAGVTLRNVDDLHEIVQQNLGSRQREVEVVEALVEAEVVQFLSWWDGQEVTPTIAALVDRADRIREQEVSRALSRMNGISERDRQTVLALSSAIVNKLLHEPITRLKANRGSDSQASYVRALHDLFSLDEVAS
jgi:glutamyl-tRNA reductase